MRVRFRVPWKDASFFAMHPGISPAAHVKHLLLGTERPTVTHVEFRLSQAELDLLALRGLKTKREIERAAQHAMIRATERHFQERYRKESK